MLSMFSPYEWFIWEYCNYSGIDCDALEDVDSLDPDNPVPKLRDDGWFELSKN